MSHYILGVIGNLNVKQYIKCTSLNIYENYRIGLTRSRKQATIFTKLDTAIKIMEVSLKGNPEFPVFIEDVSNELAFKPVGVIIDV